MDNSHKSFQFKTNINCSGCISKITPFLDDTVGIKHWEVDTSRKDKVLTINCEGITEQEVIETVQNAGFNIAPLVV